MAEEKKPEAPTMEQLSTQLRLMQFALNTAIEQRNAAQNQLIDAGAAIQEARSVAQQLASENGGLKGQVADLTQQLASRAEQRAGKKKK